jgi:hypothetical protein
MQAGSTSSVSRWLPWAIAATAVLALGVVLLRQSSDGSRDAQVETLEKRLDALQRDASNPSGTNGSAGRAAGTRPAGASNNPYARLRAMSPEQRAAEIQRAQGALQAEFEADARDPAGSRGAVTHLEDTVTGKDMASTGLVPQDLAVDCRRVLCRVSARFDRPGDAEDWATMYLSAAGGEIERAQTVQVRQPDGSTQVIIYGTRGTRATR